MIMEFISGIAKGIVSTFKGQNIYWHLFAIVLTYILVISGFDWWFFTVTRGELSNTLGMSAGLTGFAVPIIFPVLLYTGGRIIGNEYLRLVALRVAQAGVVALIIIAVYKALTGRVEPEFLAMIAGNDNSREFNFGFLRYGIFWGWPSSHTAVAFAESVCLALLYRRKLWVGALVLIYASFIGLGAAVSFHWFSDVIAGVIVGSFIGYVIYKNGSQDTKIFS